MPELPEVETVRRQLESQILKRTITGVDIRNAVIIKSPENEFAEYLQGRRFESIERRGKLLIFHLSKSSLTLHAHLKMTGQFLFQENGEVQAGIVPLLYTHSQEGQTSKGFFREDQVQEKKLLKHLHLIIHFDDGSQLGFRDQRRFGYLKLVNKEDHERILSSYGIDPLREEFTHDQFIAAFKGRKKSLKAVLMDQKIIAGIGNIYADEICFRAAVRPHRSVKRLSKKKCLEIYQHTEDVIKAALAQNGTSFSDFKNLDGQEGSFSYQLKVYGREGEACERCESKTIQKIQFLGRGTHYCPHCQR